MQTDLFTETAPPSFTQNDWDAYLAAQTEVGRQMAALVQAEEEYRIDNGIIAPWIEADYLLSKDHRRLLELVDEHAGYLMADDDWHVTPYAEDGARRVSGFTVAMAMNAEANSKAVLNAALERGLVTVTRDNDAGGNRVDMKKRGRYYLDLCQTNDYWESDESE